MSLCVLFVSCWLLWGRPRPGQDERFSEEILQRGNVGSGQCALWDVSGILGYEMLVSQHIWQEHVINVTQRAARCSWAYLRSAASAVRGMRAFGELSTAQLGSAAVNWRAAAAATAATAWVAARAHADAVCHARLPNQSLLSLLLLGCCLEIKLPLMVPLSALLFVGRAAGHLCRSGILLMWTGTPGELKAGCRRCCSLLDDKCLIMEAWDVSRLFQD